jgi:hypothetical protein
MTAMQTVRAGGKWEAAGFLLILFGGALCFASGLLGGLTIAAGFVVFIIGRFM